MPSNSTRFEALCYCLGSITSKTYYIGNITGKISSTPHSLPKDRKFTDSLFKRYYNILNNSDVPYFQNDDSVVRRVTFNTTKDQVKIILWVGNNKPTPKVISYKEVTPEQKSKRGIKPGRDSILFSLNLDCLVYSNSKKLFLTVMNAYLKVCSAKQHEDLLNAENMFRFTVYHDSPGTKPYCYASVIPVSLLNGIYNEMIQQCPDGYMTCEMGDAFSGHFVYIPISKIVNRDELSKVDVMQLD